MKLIKREKVSLKGNPNVSEADIQKFIFEDPSVLGLGDLYPLQRERIQPSGGRLDLLLADDDDARYEVEIQLGATDPSHIIRTIEYWDSERKRYPKYSHCAVIVAEEITGRFLNVISLFNGAIPLIALQMSAFKEGDDIQIVFTRVLDRIELVDDEDNGAQQSTDRAYWEKYAAPQTVKEVDGIFEHLKEFVPGYELKYNKYYIGLSQSGCAKNVFYFKPKKKFVNLFVKFRESDAEFETLFKAIEDEGVVVSKRDSDAYKITLKNVAEYLEHKVAIDNLVKHTIDVFDG